MHKIVVIEDEKRVAELLKNGLSEFGFEVSVAYDGEMGIRLVHSTHPDLVISDVILPGLDGFGVVKKIREMEARIPVIMLTALGTTDDKLEGFDAGADDYMVKPFDIRELAARINILIKRNKGRQESLPTLLAYGPLRADLNTRTFSRDNRAIELTPKEFNLIVYMMKNPERVLSRAEIAEKVWETHFDTGTNFIDVYINYLRKKIDRDHDVKLIQTKPGIGFILTEK